MNERILTRISGITLTLLFTTVALYAQSGALPEITLTGRMQSRQAVIEAIETQTAYKVIFDATAFDKNKKVDFGATRPNLETVLMKLTESTGHTYAIDNSLILIYKAAGSKPAAPALTVAERNIAGTVYDTDGGTPQENVTVEVIGSNKKASTYANGRFRVTGVTSGTHIVRLTPADGSTPRYREVNVPTGRDADVTLTLTSDMLSAAYGNPPEATGIPAPLAEKSTTYFIPANTGHTIRAFSDEAKTELSYVPASYINRKGYMPKTAVRTNLLWWSAATANVSVEFGLAPEWTLETSAVFNPFRLSGNGINRFWLVQPEARYWFCQRFEKHFVGLHVLYGEYNVGQVNFLTATFEQHRYDGWGAGAGISYGYHLPVGKRWALEFTAGAGYVYLEYDKYRCYECDEFAGSKKRHYFGPTKAGISLIFMIK